MVDRSIPRASAPQGPETDEVFPRLLVIRPDQQCLLAFADGFVEKTELG